MGVGTMKLARVQYLEMFPMLGLRLGFLPSFSSQYFLKKKPALDPAKYVDHLAHQ